MLLMHLKLVYAIDSIPYIHIFPISIERLPNTILKDFKLNSNEFYKDK